MPQLPGAAPFVPDRGRRTAAVVLTGFVGLGLLSFFPNGVVWLSIALFALPILCVAGGMVAARWLDIGGFGLAGAGGVLLSGLIQSRMASGPSSYGDTVATAIVLGVIATIIAAATFGLRRRVASPQDR